MRSKTYSTCGLTALSLLGAAISPAQVPAPRPPAPSGASGQQEKFVLRSQTNVVLVDVRVTDKSGHPDTDLKQENFRVFEDGVLQTITSFGLENVERLETASRPSATPAVIDLAKLPPGEQPGKVLQDHRLIVLFFDMTSMPVDDLMRALKAASDFVHTRMTPADLIAVASFTSSLRVLHDFTNDRDALDKVFKAFRVGESASLAEGGAQGEAGTTNAAGEEVVAQDVSAAFTPDETEFNIFNTDIKLAAVASLVRMLRDVPGRKSLIHFSSGIERTGIDNQAQLRAAVDAANQSNVSVYTMDTRGLVALPPAGDASAASPAGTAIYTGSAVHSQFSSLRGGRETLATLATDTGGKSFYDTNDFGQAFREVQEENSAYYLLGYSPSNNKSDGRFRRIRVEVTRQGLKVQARPGYFAPKDFRQFTREDKELQLQQAMDLDAPFVELPIAVEAAYFRLREKNYYVVLAAKIPGSTISFLKKSATRQTEFDFAWRATDSSGRTGAALRDTLPVKLTGEAYEQVLTSNVLYEGGFVLPAGKYRLRVLVRENQSGRLGTFEQPLDLPDIEGPGLALSSVVLSNQVQATQAGDRRGPAAYGEGRGGRSGAESDESPLRVRDRSVLPSVTRVFRTNQSLAVYLESYGAKIPNKADSPPAQAKPVPPSVALVFFRGGVKISEAGPFPGKLEKADKAEKASYFVQIPLEKFPPGRYWMQVNVLDPARDRVAFTRVPLAVVKHPSAPAPARVGK